MFFSFFLPQPRKINHRHSLKVAAQIRLLPKQLQPPSSGGKGGAGGANKPPLRVGGRSSGSSVRRDDSGFEAERAAVTCGDGGFELVRAVAIVKLSVDIVF